MRHLCAAVVMGSTQLWITFDDDQKIWGCLTTEITQYPAKRLLSIRFLGGEDFDSWYNLLLEQITRYGLDMGCDGMRNVARFGSEISTG